MKIINTFIIFLVTFSLVGCNDNSSSVKTQTKTNATISHDKQSESSDSLQYDGVIGYIETFRSDYYNPPKDYYKILVLKDTSIREAKTSSKKELLEKAENGKGIFCILPKEAVNNLKIGQIVKAHLGKFQNQMLSYPPELAVDRIEIIKNLPGKGIYPIQ